MDWAFAFNNVGIAFAIAYMVVGVMWALKG
jgi:hypothetical protein